MLLKWITNCLLFLTLIYLTHTDAENAIIAIEGDAVYLPCRSPPNDSKQINVECRKHSNHNSSTIICNGVIINITGSNPGKCIPRFKLNINSFTLSIENVQLSDSGNYSCKTTRIIPPPTLDYTSNVTLQVAVRPHLSLRKLNSSNETCVHLLCFLESMMPKRVNFTWDREGHGSLHSLTTYAMKSELSLCKPDWSDGDTITCYANYSDTQTWYTNSSITLQKNSHEVTFQLLIISCGAAAGLILFIIIIIVVICKCRRKRDENGSIVFSNKVYENFSFAMARQNTQANNKPQPEECIYEN